MMRHVPGHPGRLAGVRISVEIPARRIARLRRDSAQAQRERVEHHGVNAASKHDGMLRARPIEVGGGWVPLVPQLHLLKEIALPDDPRSPWSPASRLSERLHDIVDPLVGWRTAVDGML